MIVRQTGSNWRGLPVTDPIGTVILENFTRCDLREYAKTLNVKRGRNKTDVMTNLIESGLLTVQINLLEGVE